MDDQNAPQPVPVTETPEDSIPQVVPPSPEESVPEIDAPTPEASMPTNEPEAVVPAPDPAPETTVPAEVVTPPVTPPSIPTTTPANTEPVLLGRSVGEMRTLSHMAGIVRGRQAHERMERVMDIAREKGMIDNVGVRLALRVSRTSATRYLSELVREGRLTHHRKGNNVEYRVVG